MKRRIIALLMAGVMVFSAGCTANVSVDPDTGVVNVDGVPLNEYLEDADLENIGSDAGDDKEKPEKDRDDGEEDKDDREEDKDDREEDKENEDDGEVTEYKGGIRVKYPEEFDNAKGLCDATSYCLDVAAGIYITEFYYTGLSRDWLEEHIDIEEPAEEDEKKLKDSMAIFTSVLSIDEDRGVDELIEFFEESDEAEEMDKNSFSEITKVGHTTFFRMDAYDKEMEENLEGEFRKEFEKLYDSFDEILENAEYFEVDDPLRHLVGKKISFETKDIDGNKITSEEIFSQNEVTMVNVWATWCYWCIKELPELNEVNERIKKKNCAIVGIVGDGEDEDTINEAKKILKENGDEYLNILPWDGAFEDDFPMSAGWPTSFYVDKNGVIVYPPVVGAAVNRYEIVIDEILEGSDKETEKDKGTEKDKETEKDEENPVVSNDVNMYRVYVTDDDGDPIEGATIQICDDSTCRVQKTDKDGLAAFKTDKAKYTVHVLKQPEGYKQDTEEYELPNVYSDLHIVLKKGKD